MLKESPLMRSFHFTMDEEGGETYTNDPRDPGGPTKYGVALNFNLGTIPDKNGDGKITALDVQLLEEADALVIYRDRYWRPGKCDALPDALALAHADTLYNIGPGAAPPHPATGRQCLWPGHRRGRQDRPGHHHGHPLPGG